MIPINYSQIPPDLINATLASEDISFWENPGFDLRGLLRAAYLNLKRGEVVSGGSTITQQLVRAVVISPGKKASRTIIRKAREILMALHLTLTSSKKNILTAYLNQMYYGHLAYGVEAASQVYFNKSATQLSLAEAAFLAGIVASPQQYDPFIFPDKASERKNQVLSLMEKHKLVESERVKLAEKEKLDFKTSQFEIKAPHFVEYVDSEMENMGVVQPGVNVVTTLDYHLYSLALEIASQKVGQLKAKHDITNAALILLENESREVLVMLGGIDYFDNEIAGRVNLSLAPRQPGSALKPITYAAAFVKAETPASLIFDVPRVYLTKKGEGFTPHNYDGRYRGLVLAREALASSYNLPAVEMLSRISLESFLQTAHDLGITTLNQIDRYDLAITLGGGEVRLLDLTNAYASLARGGKFAPPNLIKKITSDSGRLLFESDKVEETLSLGEKSEQIAYLITDILSDSKARIPSFGEKNLLNLSRPAAVKTGTTTDWHDNWTVGYTSEYTVGVWVGNADNHPMRELTGVTGAAPIWHDFLEEFLKDKPRSEFIKPEGLLSLEVCRLDGRLPDGICDTREEIFIAGNEPKEKSRLYRKVRLDRRNRLLAGDDCPNNIVEEKLMIDYPAEVYSWALVNNLEVIPAEYSPLCQYQAGKEGNLWLEIISPLNGTVYENSSPTSVSEAVVFECRFSPQIRTVEWYLDDQLLSRSEKAPFSFNWQPISGRHSLYALGLSNGAGKIESNRVKFEVVNFHGE